MLDTPTVDNVNYFFELKIIFKITIGFFNFIKHYKKWMVRLLHLYKK